MHITEALNKAKKLLISLEITPPNKGQGIEEIFETVDRLIPFEPSFINVTYHQPQVTYEEIGNTIHRIPKRKKAGTVGICASITNRYNIETENKNPAEDKIWNSPSNWIYHDNGDGRYNIVIDVGDDGNFNRTDDVVDYHDDIGFRVKAVSAADSDRKSKKVFDVKENIYVKRQRRY